MDKSGKLQVEVEFPVFAFFSVNLSDLNSEDFDLSDPDELKEALIGWVADNAKPRVYHQDYSGKNQVVLIPDIPASYEVGDFDEFKIAIAESSGAQAMANEAAIAPLNKPKEGSYDF